MVHVKASRKLFILCFLLPLFLPAQASGQIKDSSTPSVKSVTPRGYTEVSADNGVTWKLLVPGSTNVYNQSTLRDLFFRFQSNPLDGTTKTEIYLDGNYSLESFLRTTEWSIFAPAYQGRHVLKVQFYYFGSVRSEGFHEYVIELSGQTQQAPPPGSPDPSDPTAQPRVRIGPKVRLETPFISTRISKTTTFKVSWSATSPSGIDSYYVRYRPANTRTWTKWKEKTRATHAYFTGTAGRTYYFRVRAVDGDGNYNWSKVQKTILPYNEGANIRKRFGFNAFLRAEDSQFYLGSLRSSYTRGNTLVYRLRNTNGIGLVTTLAKNRGRAKLYIDGQYVTTIDAYSPKFKPRQRVYYWSFPSKSTHYLKIINEGTPGRSRFDVDGIVAGR